MSIERLDNQMELCCDTCPRTLPRVYFSDEFGEMIQDAKDEHWRFFKDEDDNWCHECPTCRRKDR